ncbi:hypothetical protein [Leucobacter luti]|nr:hypothetical protein [Leucobacter luti]
MKKKKMSGKARAALAVGSLLGVAALATTAAFTDFANINLGSGGEGIGSSSKFDIAVVDTDDTVLQADTEAGVDWVIPGADSFVPGRTLTTTIPVFNNSKTITGDLSVVVEAIGDGSIGTSPNIMKFLKFSATDTSTGTVLFGDPADPTAGVDLASAEAEIADVAARGADSLAEGDAYVSGANGSEHTIELQVHFTDEPETADYNGGQAALRVHIDAQSK